MLYLLLMYEVEICNEIKGSYFLRTNIGTVVQVTVFLAPFFQYAVSLETGMGVPKLIEGNGQEVPAKKQMSNQRGQIITFCICAVSIPHKADKNIQQKTFPGCLTIPLKLR